MGDPNRRILSLFEQYVINRLENEHRLENFFELVHNYDNQQDEQFQRALEISFEVNVENAVKTRPRLKTDQYVKFTKLRKATTEDRVDEKNCSICQSGYKTHMIATLPCDHDFHHTCLKRWLINYGASCPLCNQPVEELFNRASGSEEAA